VEGLRPAASHRVAPQGAYLLNLGTEESHCLTAFGDAYRTCRERTLKYLGRPHRLPQ